MSDHVSVDTRHQFRDKRGARIDVIYDEIAPKFSLRPLTENYIVDATDGRVYILERDDVNPMYSIHYSLPIIAHMAAAAKK